MDFNSLTTFWGVRSLQFGQMAASHNNCFQKKAFFGSDDDRSPPCFLHSYIIYRIYPPLFQWPWFKWPGDEFGVPLLNMSSWWWRGWNLDGGVDPRYRISQPRRANHSTQTGFCGWDGFMYGRIFTYICLIFMATEGRYINTYSIYYIFFIYTYAIHRSYGICNVHPCYKHAFYWNMHLGLE